MGRKKGETESQHPLYKMQETEGTETEGGRSRSVASAYANVHRCATDNLLDTIRPVGNSDPQTI